MRNGLVTLTNGQLQSTKINTSSWFQIMGRGRDKGGVEIKRGKQQLKKSNINALIVYEKASNETLQCSIIRRLISKVLIHFTAILNTT